MNAAIHIDRYLAGDELYGDDFTTQQLEKWWREEEEGYSGLIDIKNKKYKYNYYELNDQLFFRSLVLPKNAVVLGLGSALGHELKPIADQIGSAIIIDPSDTFADHHVLGDRPIRYVKPAIDGKFQIADDQVDLVTCFGVLHHIANVSTVLRECHRVLRPGGRMLCREPIVTQGDWRRPRRGLTKNERGIPLKLFRFAISSAGFTVEAETLCDFAPFQRMLAKVGKPAFASKIGTMLDLGLSRLFSFNTKYHRPKVIDRFGPASVGYVLRK